jgi:hypothetical protein
MLPSMTMTMTMTMAEFDDQAVGSTTESLTSL